MAVKGSQSFKRRYYFNDYQSQPKSLFNFRNGGLKIIGEGFQGWPFSTVSALEISNKRRQCL